MAVPAPLLEWSPTTGPMDTPVWEALPGRVRRWELERGRQNEYDRIEVGQVTLTLKNNDRALDPSYAGSPLYPNVKTMKQMRFGFDLAGTTYWLLTGYMYDLPRRRQGNRSSDVDVTIVDGFEPLGRAALLSSYAALTTALAGSNNDLVFTAAARGHAGNLITIAYIVSGTSTPLSVSVVGTAVTVNVATDGGGAATSTGAQVMDAVNAHGGASALVTASLAASNDGTGVVAAMAAAALAGGTFVEQLSGSRISACLDAISWAAAARDIDVGKSMIQAATFAEGDDQKALPHLQDVAIEAEMGLLFMSKTGLVTFIDRHALITAPYSTVQATFSDKPAGGELGYASITPVYTPEKIVNRWEITPDGLATQVAEDAQSREDYFPRDDSKTVLVTTEAEAEAQGQFRLRRTKEPLQQFEEVRLAPGDSTDLWEQVLARELGDRVALIEHPVGGGSANEEEVHIQRIRISGGADIVDTVCDWNVYAAARDAFLTLDDPALGRLDENALAY